MKGNNQNIENDPQQTIPYRPQKQKLFRVHYSNANPVYLTFNERVEQSQYIVSLEDTNIKNKKNKKKKRRPHKISIKKL